MEDGRIVKSRPWPKAVWHLAWALSEDTWAQGAVRGSCWQWRGGGAKGVEEKGHEQRCSQRFLSIRHAKLWQRGELLANRQGGRRMLRRFLRPIPCQLFWLKGRERRGRGRGECCRVYREKTWLYLLCASWRRETEIYPIFAWGVYSSDSLMENM